jgi:hypothetical protein
MTGIIFAIGSTLAIIALCLVSVLQELHDQTPRNTHRHFGL